VPFGLFAKKQKCGDCGTSFETWEELVEHAKKEHKRNVLKCNKCKKEFLYESERYKHLKEVHRK
jgi:NAD-dependent SIR2 family protein deacetylase